ncbi:hydantoinase B/oxoprolinase family protein [Alloalcanivorax marinus]|uniref:hydantoinase B/oxoprolinase family protein n=1 Tax=Alloalcanivorax marinus TaxID=1177169 RepID=UPI00193201D7|nr:hydantoinase B/oxoprolinase family protein [Alloalcanivorax marinus]MBL7250408.1 hydantoinase B/oxoprolinase family protein [Alloalcanivorax marinus]
MTEENINPITLEVWWSRLAAIADEAATTLLRTAFSTIIREANDYSVVLLNADGETIAECRAGIPAFHAIMGVMTRHILEKFPVDTWRPGDCVITNHPWMATGHLPDIAMVAPIFHGDRLVGFSATAAHVPDIGGTPTMGATELISEGLLIPPVRIARAGERNQDFVDFLLDNVRYSDQVLGDLEAQMAAHDVCRRRVVEFLLETGQQDLVMLSTAMHDAAERVMRKEIEALPDGVYRSSLDADGVEGQPTRIECSITVAGDRMHIDYEGSSPQVNHSINCTINYTTAYSIYPVKILLDPHTRRNEGSYRPITVSAPEGSIVNARFPAPVMARHLTGHMLSCLIYQALAETVPESVIADSGGAPALRVQLVGRDAQQKPFSMILFACAGMGASSRHDGLSTTAFPSNSGSGSIEALEVEAPILFLKKEYRPDSGGAGRYRGGLGQDVRVENITGAPMRVALVGDREKNPPVGILGGAPGAGGRATFSHGESASLKSMTMMPADASVTVSFAGGGGYGPPAARDRAAIAADIDAGLVSKEAAIRDYGYDPTDTVAGQ